LLTQKNSHKKISKIPSKLFFSKFWHKVCNINLNYNICITSKIEIMKTETTSNRNRKLYYVYSILFIMSFLQSCVYYEQPYPQGSYNGNAYVRLNWSDREPDYVDANGIVPSNFNWNTYYKSFPGYYTVHYEYDYYSGSHVITDAYDAKVEIWVNRSESSSSNSYSQYVADNNFELMLYPDGGYDYNLTSGLKSNNVSTKSDTLIQKKNGMTMRIIISKVEARKLRDVRK